MRTHPGLLLAALAGLAVTGCGGGRERPPSTEVAVVHAAPGYPDITFLRSLRTEGTIAFRQGTIRTFDSDTYTFNFQIELPGETEPMLVNSFSYDVTGDERYLIVLAEVGGVIEPVVLAQPKFDVESTDTEFRFVHAAESLPEVDLYVEPPGTDLATATARGSIGFLGDVAPATTAAGDYEIALTAPGDPAAVLFRSSSILFAAGDALRFVIIDGAGEGLAPLYVVAISSATESVATLANPDLPASLRAINAGGDRLARDVYLRDDFSAPLVGALEFGAVSTEMEVDPGEVNVSVTSAGNPSAVEFEDMIALSGTLRYNTVIAGDPGATVAATFSDNFRSLAALSTFRLINAVNFYDTLEVFLATPGTDITTAAPQFALTSPTWSARTTLTPGDYELTLRDPESQTVVFGPQIYSLAAGGVYTIAAIDSADGTTADLILLDGFD